MIHDSFSGWSGEDSDIMIIIKNNIIIFQNLITDLLNNNTQSTAIKFLLTIHSSSPAINQLNSNKITKAINLKLFFLKFSRKVCII